MRRLAWLSGVAFMALAASAAAEGDEGGSRDDAGQHVEVVVTASKHGQKITEAPAAVTVITADDIEASGALGLADLFRRIPGLDFMQVSARDYNVNARGFNNTLSRRLLVLVDGRSVYLDLLGFTLWDGIQVTLDDIERIEVVRGPGSALYGANASSGVVNIITKAPKDIDGGVAHAGYGEFATGEAGILYGDAAGKLGYKVSASYYQTDAFDNPDKDGDSRFQRKGEVASRQPKGMFRVSYDFDDDSRFTVDGGYGATSGTLYTGIGPLDIQPGSYSPFVRTAYTRGDFFFQGFWNGLKGETLNLTSLQTNHFTTNAYDLEGQYSHQLGERNFVVLGASARLADIASDLTSKDESELTCGVYGQDEIKLSDRWTGNAAFRIDHDPLIGTVFAPKGGIVFAPNPKHSFRLTAATAYNSSSFIESYLDYTVKIPIGGGNTLDIDATGNTELDPERIVSFELGYRAFPRDNLLLDVNLFHARLHDFIQFIATDFYDEGKTVPKSYTYVNAGSASETGIELSAELYLSERLGLFGSYAYTDTSQSDEVSDVAASNKASLTLQYVRRKGFQGSLAVTYSDKLFFPPSTAFYRSGTVPSYTLVNGSACYSFLKDGALSAGIRGTNLLDHKHREFIAGDIIERKVIGEIKLRF
ncbi:MAG: TonB-dependent receptor [Acidobacteriota bacterium]